MERPTRVQRTLSQKKFVFWISFSRTGVFDVVVLPPGERFTRKFFVAKVMDSFGRMRVKKRPTLLARGKLLHLESSDPHLASKTFKHHGITRLRHPPDIPDLSPADFWLFGSINATLEGFSSRTSLKQERG
jgi:hypothetical protein